MAQMEVVCDVEKTEKNMAKFNATDRRNDLC